MDDQNAKMNEYRLMQENIEANDRMKAAIEHDIISSQPIISELLPISVLSHDFSGNKIYMEKLEQMIHAASSSSSSLPQNAGKPSYSRLRRIRGDGNCFYRAFAFALFENLALNSQPRVIENLERRAALSRDYLIRIGYAQIPVDDIFEQFMEIVELIKAAPSSAGGGALLTTLETNFNQQSYADYSVAFLRMVVSSYLQENADFYCNFIDENIKFEEFCHKFVEPMGVDIDNIHISALSKALQIPIEVVNCQLSGDLSPIQFPSADEEADPNTAIPTHARLEPPISLLYRPGHYDILYKSGNDVTAKLKVAEKPPRLDIASKSAANSVTANSNGNNVEREEQLEKAGEEEMASGEPANRV